jgi:hypothetical protein
MSLQRTINLLQSATNPARSLDAAIAESIGWKRLVDVRKDPSSGEEVKSTTWIMPNSNEPGKVPFYSANLQHAYDLAQKLAPSHVGGCSWEYGKGSARINNGSYVQAANPQIALCIAALLTLV